MVEGNGSRLKVGIAGLGRSGWSIHAKALEKMSDHYQVVAVADADQSRLDEAKDAFGCRTYLDFNALLDDKDMDILVVASPNLFHVEHSMTAMRNGMHVVCEKPMALGTEEADAAIACANETGRILAPFQNRRFEPHLLKVKELIDSGLFGRIIQVRLSWHQFTRRWDWQTLKEFGGGSLFNNGAHLTDQAMVFLGEDAPEPEIFVDLQKALTCGDTEDHVKIVLKAEGRPTIDLELTSASAFPMDRWHVMGTNGGLRGDLNTLEWKWVDWSTMPKRTVDRVPMPDRSYNNEDINWQTASWTKPADYPGEAVMFYRNLYQVIRHSDALFVTPKSVRQQIAVLERCRQACPV